MPEPESLSRRERQIMDILFAEGEAAVRTIREQMPDELSATAVRTFLRILTEKGHVRRRRAGREYLYRPKARRTPAGRSALNRVLDTFFEGSLEKALAAHLADRRGKPSDEELDRIRGMIDEARERGQ